MTGLGVLLAVMFVAAVFMWLWSDRDYGIADARANALARQVAELTADNTRLTRLFDEAVASNAAARHGGLAPVGRLRAILAEVAG